MSEHPKISDVNVRHPPNVLAAPYNNTVVFDRNTGLLKHFTVILVYTLYNSFTTSVEVVTSGPTLILFCKMPKESEWGMKGK